MISYPSWMRYPLRSNLGLLASLLVIMLASRLDPGSAPVVAAAGPSDIRFGAVEAYRAPAAAWQAGVAWQRVRFHWAQIQAGGPGEWNDGEFTDEVLARELAAGRQVIGLLIGLPEWANESGIPRGLHMPHTDSGNTWAAFVRAVVGRYAGRIDHWIIWNEPDVWDPNHPGHTWGGSVDDFLQLTRAGYVTAKETNPSAVIHLTAVTHWWDAAFGRDIYFRRFLDRLVADPNAVGNNYYFDVATLHLYFQPHYIFDLTSYYYGLMGTYGIWKPIWIVETNAAPSTDPSWPVADPRFHVSLEEQAAYIPQALALGLAAGAERIGIYKLIDTPGDAAANPEPFGLIRADGSRRPAYTTFQVATAMLAGSTRAIRDRWDDVGQVTMEQRGGSVTVLFSRVPGQRSATVVANSPTGTLVDMTGNRRMISAQDGLFHIELPPAPCSQSVAEYCMIGGPTYYLVQGAPVAVAPSPTASASPTAAPAPATTTRAPTAWPTVALSTATARLTATTGPTRTARPTSTARPTATARPSATARPTAAARPTAIVEPTETARPTSTARPTATPLPFLDAPPPTSVAQLGAATTTLRPTLPAQSSSPESHRPATGHSSSLLTIGAVMLVAGLAGLGVWLRRR